MLPSSERRAITTYKVPSLAWDKRHANGCFCVIPWFFGVQDLPPLLLLYTPRPKPATYNTRAFVGLFGSSRMCVAPVSSMPVLDLRQVFPPSSLTQTPPLNFAGSVCRHIFGRGRS